MKIRVFVTAAAIAACSLARLPAAPSLMPIEDVKPGMVGIGRTVFEGSELKDFKVHILGVLRNVQAPKRNLILARLEGGPLAETGVIAGMSGSPVYIDGRLVGAVSYSIGAFRRNPSPASPDRRNDRGDGRHRRPRAVAPAPRLELPVTIEHLASAVRALSTARAHSPIARPMFRCSDLAASGSQMGAPASNRDAARDEA
jgi:hypothetical protein